MGLVAAQSATLLAAVAEALSTYLHESSFTLANEPDLSCPLACAQKQLVQAGLGRERLCPSLLEAQDRRCPQLVRQEASPRVHGHYWQAASPQAEWSEAHMCHSQARPWLALGHLQPVLGSACRMLSVQQHSLSGVVLIPVNGMTNMDCMRSNQTCTRMLTWRPSNGSGLPCVPGGEGAYCVPGGAGMSAVSQFAGKLTIGSRGGPSV